MNTRRLGFSLVGVAAVGVFAWLALSGRSGEVLPAGTDGRLVAAARELGAAQPDLFGNFAPIGPGERKAVRPGGARGGLVAHRPVGTILGTRPPFSWDPVKGVHSVEVTLRADDGALVWKRASPTNSMDYPADAPALEPGQRYAWELFAKGPSGPLDGKRSFAVASHEERTRLESASREIDARVVPTLRALMKAHWAARHELLEEALRAADEAVGALPSDEVAHETRAFVRHRLGSASAD